MGFLAGYPESRGDSAGADNQEPMAPASSWPDFAYYRAGWNPVSWYMCVWLGEWRWMCVCGLFKKKNLLPYRKLLYIYTSLFFYGQYVGINVCHGRCFIDKKLHMYRRNSSLISHHLNPIMGHRDCDWNISN